jgi:hypothetical protein
MKKSMNTFMKRGGFIIDQHSNRVVGKALNWKESIHPKLNKEAISVDYQIFDDYTVDDTVWEETKNGKRKGLSFGGRALGKSETKMSTTSEGKHEPAKFLGGDIEAYEISSVIRPANEGAENTHVNFMAKSVTEKSEDILKPCGAKFESCVADVKDKNPKANAYAVCHAALGKMLDKELEFKTKEEADGVQALINEMSEKYGYTAADQIHVVESIKPLKGNSTKETVGDKMESTHESKKEEVKQPESPISKEDIQIQLLKDISAKLDKLTEKQEAKKPEDEEEDKKKPEPPAKAAETVAPALTQKEVEQLVEKKVDDVMKSKGIVKLTTPRPETDIVKNHQVKKQDFALELLEKAKKGMSQADLNREIKKFDQTNYEKGLRAVMDTVGEGG